MPLTATGYSGLFDDYGTGYQAIRGDRPAKARRIAQYLNNDIPFRAAVKGVVAGENVQYSETKIDASEDMSGLRGISTTTVNRAKTSDENAAVGETLVPQFRPATYPINLDRNPREEQDGGGASGDASGSGTYS